MARASDSSVTRVRASVARTAASVARARYSPNPERMTCGTVRPRPEYTALYEERYAMYRELYPRLRDQMHALAASAE